MTCYAFFARKRNKSGLVQPSYVIGPEIQNTESLISFIKNTSSSCMVFPYNYGVKIYMERNGSWVDVPNMTDYRSKEDIQLLPAGNMDSDNVVVLRPNLLDVELQAPTNFRAVLNGHLCDDENVLIKKIVPFTVVP
jgi:hypothetical protein